MKLGATALLGHVFGVPDRGVKCPKLAIFGSTDWLQTLCLASVVDVFSRYDTGS